MATFINVFSIKLLALILSMEVIAEIISCKTMLAFAILLPCSGSVIPSKRHEVA